MRFFLPETVSILRIRQTYQLCQVLWLTVNMSCQTLLTCARPISHPIEYFSVVFIPGQERGGEESSLGQVNDEVYE